MNEWLYNITGEQVAILGAMCIAIIFLGIYWESEKRKKKRVETQEEDQQ